MNERPTFSPFWHRIRAMKPRLRPHVQITRQRYRGRRWHVAHDPTSNQFYRLNPIAHDFVNTLDGRRNVEEAWKVSLGKFGDAAPTQNEVLELIGQLYNANLLSIDQTPEIEQLLRRKRERVKKKAVQQAIGIMYFRVRVFNPDRLLTLVEPVFRPVLNLWGFIALAAIVLFAAANVLPEWRALGAGFSDAIAPANWPWLIVIFIVSKAWHELGHGVICKRFGGQVPEFGIMLLVLFPAPYVDASSCWAFQNKWRRIAVGAGGMMFELLLASIAVFIWLGAEEGSLARQLSYNMMLTATVTTLLFNGNPLMKFDAYYILSDLIEVPNLMQRSFKMLGFYFQKHIYRVENPRCPTTDRGEAAILTVYGIAALAYRIFLFFSITLYVMGKLFALGLLLAIWTAGMWFIMPVGKFVHWLSTNPQLSDRRPWAITATLIMIAGVASLLGLVPMSDHRYGDGVVDAARNSGVFAMTPGMVAQVHKEAGDPVRAGEAIVTMESPDLIARRKQLLAAVAELEAGLRWARFADRPVEAEAHRRKLAVVRDAIDDIDHKMELLVLRAPHDGVIVGRDPKTLLGGFIKAGDPVCEVADMTTRRVAAILPQGQAPWLYSLPAGSYTVEYRLISALEEAPYAGEVQQIVDAGQVELRHPALSYAGGGTIQTDPEDRHGTRATSSYFVVYIDASADQPEGRREWAGLPGERVRVRFELPSRPLIGQWADRLHRILQGRVNI